MQNILEQTTQTERTNKISIYVYASQTERTNKISIYVYAKAWGIHSSMGFKGWEISLTFYQLTIMLQIQYTSIYRRLIHT